MLRRQRIISSSAITGGTANLVKSTKVIATLSFGDNTIPHGVTGTIVDVFVLDNNNSKIDFSSLRFDDTNIYVRAYISKTVIFKIFYKS